VRRLSPISSGPAPSVDSLAVMGMLWLVHSCARIAVRSSSSGAAQRERMRNSCSKAGDNTTAMKQLALALALFATTASAGEILSRGAAVSRDAQAVPLAKVLASPEDYTRNAVVVEGTVTTACERKGCWMQLGDGKDAVRVTFKDYAFFVPLDSKGMQARAEGVTTVKKLSKGEADHLEEEGAKLKRNADGSANEVSFVASGVELTR
jgi:hypothetical protein